MREGLAEIVLIVSLALRLQGKSVSFWPIVLSVFIWSCFPVSSVPSQVLILIECFLQISELLPLLLLVLIPLLLLPHGYSARCRGGSVADGCAIG